MARYAIAATTPHQSKEVARAVAALGPPLSISFKLAGTTAFATLIETLAQADPCRLHAHLCEATSPHALIWVELPAEEKERAREALLAARGHPLPPPAIGAATAVTLGYLLAWEAAERRVSVSLVVEVIDPTDGPGVSVSPWELRIDLPTEQQKRDAPWDADACLDDLEGRMALQPSQWCADAASGLSGADAGDLQAEALAIWSLVALLGNPRSHLMRAPSVADGAGQAGAGFLILDVPQSHS